MRAISIKQLVFLAICVVIAAAAFSDSLARERKKFFRAYTVVVYGDGITAGYGIEREQAYPSILRDKLNIEFKNDRIEVINAGVAGDTAASGASRIASILELKPLIVVIAFGMSDAQKGIDPNVTYKALDQMLSTLTYNNIYVILCGFKAPDSMSLAEAARFNSLYPELADRYKVAYLRYLLKGVEGVWYNNQFDGFYPNEDGHKVIAGNLHLPVVEMLRKVRLRDF